MAISQKQLLSNQRFYLYERPLHPELFDIFRSCRLVKRSYEAHVWVTGRSHVIGFYRKGVSLVEVTADATAKLPQHGLVLELPLRGERDHEFGRTGIINYMMNFQVERMSPAVYARTHQELSSPPDRRGLFVSFPMWMAGDLTPFTYVDYQAKPSQLHVYAYHAFPEDHTIVKTQSIFELG